MVSFLIPLQGAKPVKTRATEHVRTSILQSCKQRPSSSFHGSCKQAHKICWHRQDWLLESKFCSSRNKGLQDGKATELYQDEFCKPQRVEQNRFCHIRSKLGSTVSPMEGTIGVSDILDIGRLRVAWLKR